MTGNSEFPRVRLGTSASLDKRQGHVRQHLYWTEARGDAGVLIQTLLQADEEKSGVVESTTRFNFSTYRC